MSVTNIRVRTTSARPKPASARAASMIARTARVCPARSPGWSDRPSGPASVVPATQHAVADHDRPAVAGDRLERAARRDPPASRRAVTAGSRARPGPPGRPRSPGAGRPAASSAARSSRPRGTRPANGRCRRSGRVRRGSGCPCPRSCWRRTRRRWTASRDLEPERLRDGLRVLHEPAAPGRASPSATSAPSPRTRPTCPGPRSPRRSAGSPPPRPRARSRVVAADVDLERAALGARRSGASRRR